MTSKQTRQFNSFTVNMLRYFIRWLHDIEHHVEIMPVDLVLIDGSTQVEHEVVHGITYSELAQMLSGSAWHS